MLSQEKFLLLRQSIAEIPGDISNDAVGSYAPKREDIFAPEMHATALDPSIPVVPQMLILAATSMVPEFCILTGYGWLAHRAAHSAAKFGVTGNVNRWLARVEGAGLLGCATLVLRFNRT